MACPGVHDHTCRFVDHQHVSVLVHHRQRNGFRFRTQRLGLGQLNVYPHGLGHQAMSLDRLPVKRDVAGLERARHLRPRALLAGKLQLLNNRDIHADTDGIGAQIEFEDFAYQIEVFSDAIGLITRSTMARSK